MKFTEVERIKIKKFGIANGCGRSKGFSFSGFTKCTLHLLPNYIDKKGTLLIEEIEDTLCFEHDIFYFEGNTLKAKHKADKRFCKGLEEKLHWTPFIMRKVFILLVFTGLSIVGHLAFNYSYKRSIKKFLKSS